jgi:Mor family transcriptional regulator
LVYKNARGILPDALIEEIQKYIDGASIYIPAKTDEKTEWGHRNGTKARLAKRNAEIRSLFERNVSVSELSDRYYLSSDTVRKIIRAVDKQRKNGDGS